MRRRTLTDLANNPDLISGIYNYCDRWCERCPLTSRCLVYATEQEDNELFENHDLRNEAFWQKLGAIIVAGFTVIGALGAVAQGWAAYNDWACKVKWIAVCPN